ncbi:MAG: hypothetical protein ABSG31_02255 [Tepidisphaeraceae bacterium]|jgi:hypothetical protein
MKYAMRAAAILAALFGGMILWGCQIPEDQSQSQAGGQVTTMPSGQSGNSAIGNGAYGETPP